MQQAWKFCLVICLLFFFPTPAALYCTQLQWKDLLKEEHVGDFVVTEHENTYSLLWIHSLSDGFISLEEVAIPQDLINLKTIDWQKWLTEKGKGHTSWTRYQIDLRQDRLLYAFSFSKKGWLRLDDTQQFLTRLLSLSLSRLPQERWRKIGPPPMSSEEDRRAVWTPPLILHGKKVTSPPFEVWETTWPRDKTPMSGCRLEIYFATQEFAFPLPYWIEVKSPHYSAKIRTIDSGHGLTSPWSTKIIEEQPLELQKIHSLADPSISRPSSPS